MALESKESSRAKANGFTLLNICNLSKEYPLNGKGSLLALDDVCFGVQRGELVSIVGPSGCGKTTLLMCIAGLMSASKGHVLLGEKDVKGPPRDMVMIFQDYTNSLLPWRTALGNVLFALEQKSIARKERLQIAEDFLQGVGLEDFKKHYPWQLSGGMQQRVAMARGLAYGSEIILMDEPFASVDAQTRVELEDFLLAVWEKYGRTILFVTHDIDEAVYLSDRIIVLSKRPATVLDVVEVDLRRPRHQIETKSDSEFIALRNRVYKMIRS